MASHGTELTTLKLLFSKRVFLLLEVVIQIYIFNLKPPFLGP
jgi:hypothetical protein